MSRSEDGSDILHGTLDRQLVDDFLAEKGLNLDLDLWNNFILAYSQFGHFKMRGFFFMFSLNLVNFIDYSQFYGSNHPVSRIFLFSIYLFYHFVIFFE